MFGHPIERKCTGLKATPRPKSVLNNVVPSRSCVIEKKGNAFHFDNIT